MASLTVPITESWGIRWMASISAQRRSRDPCLVTCPRATLVTGLAVPRRQDGLRAQPGRVLEPVTSPISEVITAARTGPMPGSAWITW